ncbi:protein farnesyltransferase/geranylgeranyltransferase type-1 subunit alpha, partial [Tremellales sp. Uapishka_1]
MASLSSYIPLQARDQWADLAPIPQDDGPAPLVPIMYSEEYKDAMDHFRALSASGEHSERGLELTETIIRLNPAHYTVWQYRMAILLELKADLEKELELMNEFARENLKSYQVWHHRLLLLTHLSPLDPTKEIDFIHDALVPDPKNYHTWAYLHWLYSHFAKMSRISSKDWENEEKWCDEMLRVDGRNNSAWGWRWFLQVGREGAKATSDDGEAEISYTLTQIHKIPHNVSAWNYLRGLLTRFKRPHAPLLPSILPYTSRPPSTSSATPTDYIHPLPSFPLSDDTPLPVPLALEFLAESLLEQGSKKEAALVYAELSTEHDRMRAGYWEYRRLACEE